MESTRNCLPKMVTLYSDKLCGKSNALVLLVNWLLVLYIWNMLNSFDDVVSDGETVIMKQLFNKNWIVILKNVVQNTYFSFN